MEYPYMREALAEAKLAMQEDEVPIGAVIVYKDQVIARAHNHKERKQQATSHAEVEVINQASKVLGTWNLSQCDLYVTLEPCPMCAGAIQLSRIRTVYYGAIDPKGGAIESICRLYNHKGFNHYPITYGGILEEECQNILKEYFQMKRSK
ncbi:MAG: nucleoside deaminase [Erysipelotrichaceae bacterium]|nr:nucleoside deaminase [Erysipelotrichaceae bacterium]MBR3693086.1 nucleoside deaminase [Erysipelotrichales bacterium]